MATKQKENENKVLSKKELEKYQTLPESEYPNLYKYGRNITAEYKAKDSVTPVIGRDKETRRSIEALSQKYKNNLLLVGGAGTGKTALVEGIAQKIAKNEATKALEGKEIWIIDLATLSSADTGDGGFQFRIKALIGEIEKSDGIVIPFIDEFHTIIGAGAEEGGLDAANILKPALARGTLHMIGATTLAEYHKNLEKDGAMTRRFKRVMLKEPSPNDTIEILRGRRRPLEIYHGVTIDDKAIKLAVEMSGRYITSRNFPDKAIDVLDQAATATRLNIDSMPESLSSLQNKIAENEANLKEETNKVRIKELQAILDVDKPKFKQLKKDWELQKNILAEIKKKRQELQNKHDLVFKHRSKNMTADDAKYVANLIDHEIPKKEKELNTLKKTYRSLHPMIDDEVTEESIMQVIQDETNIPVSKLSESELQRMRMLNKELHKRVIGQNKAVDDTAYAIKRSRLGLGDPSQPIGAFLFLGSSGVGKASTDDTLIPVYGNHKTHQKRAGDLMVGDYVFNRQGQPEKVTGVFHHVNKTFYRVELADGRHLDVSGDHNWGVVTTKTRRNNNPIIKKMTTKELINAGLYSKSDSVKYFIPANEAVKWPDYKFNTDPYVLGSFIANGSLTDSQAVLSSDSIEQLENVSKLLPANEVKFHNTTDYNNSFRLLDTNGKKHKMGLGYETLQTKSLLNKEDGLDVLINKKSHEKFIPEKYKYGSIEQRWSLIQGLFDCDGSVDNTYRLHVTYSSVSLKLVEDIQNILYSLGISSSICKYQRNRKYTDGSLCRPEYSLRIKCSNTNKLNFFRVSAKKDIVKYWLEHDTRSRIKKFNFIGIKSITKLPGKQNGTCILVDDPEHLYQAGDYVVTHNTELVKALAELMFGDETAMQRFDMGEFQDRRSVARLVGAAPGDAGYEDGGELTEWVKNNPYSIVLLDEAEKANPGVWDLMLSVFDDGELTDSKGESVNFKNNIIIMTSNLGSQEILRAKVQPNGDIDERHRNNVMATIRNSDPEKGGRGFRPEFINRLDDIVIFLKLTREEDRQIAKLKLHSLAKRVYKSRKIHLVYSAPIQETLKDNSPAELDVSKILADKMTPNDMKLGARPINRYIREDLEDVLVDMLLNDGIKDGAYIYVQATYPAGPKLYTDPKDGKQRPVKPIIKFDEISEQSYERLIKLDPTLPENKERIEQYLRETYPQGYQNE